MPGPIYFRLKTRRGFTLVEIMVAMSLGLLVAAAVSTTFIWTGRQSILCAKIAWSQGQAMRTSNKIEGYIRNATSISGIDTNLGDWVEVKFGDGTTGRFTYYNNAATNTQRGGMMYLVKSGSSELLVARGLTKIPNPNGIGFPIAMFTKINDRAIRVSYRVAEPTPSGIQAADDGLYAAYARFAACLRNAKK
jgi:prepilin-type N-terminal cleavage/methylation domain-containing protein